MDEQALMHAYRHTLGRDTGIRPARLVAGCVCGVDIVSKTAHAEDVMRAVSDHNGSIEHLAWRAQLPPDPTVPVNTVDVSGHGDTSGPAGEAA